MGDALSEQLLPVRTEETDQGREVQELLPLAVGHLDYDLAVTHERSAVRYLDVGPAGPRVSERAPGRFGYG